MPDITPNSRLELATGAAVQDGIMSGVLIFLPSSFALWTAMKYPKFVKSTNWQSRTALVLMPTLFAFAIASEQKLYHKMREMANETEHSREVSKWATETNDVGIIKSDTGKVVEEDTNRKLHALYRSGVEESGVRVVPSDRLGVHHHLANFWHDNPFKVLAALSVPTILYIFKGANEKKHLKLQSKLMHTRVFGQFAVLTMLLSLMGFKSYMDTFGKFITEQEAESRVEEMKRMRSDLLERIAFDKKINKQRQKVLDKGKKT